MISIPGSLWLLHTGLCHPLQDTWKSEDQTRGEKVKTITLTHLFSQGVYPNSQDSEMLYSETQTHL